AAVAGAAPPARAGRDRPGELVVADRVDLAGLAVELDPQLGRARPALGDGRDPPVADADHGASAPGLDPRGRPQHIRADGVAGLDVGDPLDLDVRPGELLEQGQLVGAGGRPGPGHPGAGAVVLSDQQAAVAGAGAVGHVAVLVLDGGQGPGQL